jgi:uncharacterized protein YydD (DUF2326 family)
MLTEIASDVLRVRRLRLTPGLNVVLGDENATNSIGKSSLLMIVDFAFGGNTLLEYNTDLIPELGHHFYLFTFTFDDQEYRFQRRTQEPDVVYRCDHDGRPVAALSVADYTAFLKTAYHIALPDLSFRALVGLYARVWGKDNLVTDRPLHAKQSMPARECVDNLLKTYDAYGAIRLAARELAAADAQLKALKGAVKHQIVPPIGKRTYSSNAKRIVALEAELADIKANLAKYATNLSEVVNKEVLGLKLEKDRLLSLRLVTQTRLQRTQENLTNNRHISSRHFADVVRYFPDVDQQRLARVEEFHDGIASILREELRDSSRHLRDDLERIDAALASIDEQMASALGSVSEPAVLVDRVYKVAIGLRKAQEENGRFEEQSALEEKQADLRNALAAEKTRILGDVQGLVNGGLRRVVDIVFGSDRKSPHLELRESNYSYTVPEDTGTGTAYAGLVLFDLTVFSSTQLPVVVHDSVLFKNIENDSVARLLRVYSETAKQSFIALDEISKYGPEAEELLQSRTVIRLDNANVLFVKDWRR